MDDTLVGELGVGGRSNGKTRGRSLSPGGGGCLDGTAEWAGIGTSRSAIVVSSAALARASRRTTGTTLLASLNDLPLSLPHVHALVKLLTHRRVVGVEARGQAGEAHVVGGQGAGGPRGEGARGVDNVVGGGEIEAARAVSRSGHVGGGGLFLDDDLGSGSRAAGRKW